MSATRLTKMLREEIHIALMERAYVERREEVTLMEHALAMDVYNDQYSPKIQKQMNDLPEEFFERVTVIRVAFDGNYSHLSLPKEVPLGHHHCRSSWAALHNYPTEHELTEQFKRYHKVKQEYEIDHRRLSAESSSILESCTTVKKLIETWPEVEPLLQKLKVHPVQSKEVFLPAVRQDMNALFNLPPEEEQDNQALAA